MAKTFDVPDSIPLSKLQEFVRSLGIPTTDLIQLNVGGEGVYVELWAHNADGKRYIPPGSGEAARHRIAIPLNPDA